MFNTEKIMYAESFLSRYMRRRMRSLLALNPNQVADGWIPPSPPKEGCSFLYLHVPFCEQLCPYCSFNRVKIEGSLAREYFDSLRTEMRMYRSLGYVFESVYVGGGTPTILPDELEATLRLARELWPISKISVETNPNDLTPRVLNGLRELKISRLSVGVQSFDDDVLRAIGRYEKYGSSAIIRDRLSAVAGMFETLNVDMMFNFPMQTEALLRSDVEAVKALNVDQVTFYPLMSPRADTDYPEASGRAHHLRERRFYDLIRRELEESYVPSSVWCFSRTRTDGESQDPYIDEYIVENDYYAGLGSGSFGYVDGTLYSNTFSIPQYIALLKTGNLPIVATKRFSGAEQIRYDFLIKLFGGSLGREYFEGKYRGLALLKLWKELLFFRLLGAVRLSDRELALTRRGHYLWVVLMREFFTGINVFREHCLSLT
jgi:coproporphyrinogen III oxidase-like Fe-S oxidoreductase